MSLRKPGLHQCCTLKSPIRSIHVHKTDPICQFMERRIIEGFLWQQVIGSGSFLFGGVGPSVKIRGSDTWVALEKRVGVHVGVLQSHSPIHYNIRNGKISYIIAWGVIFLLYKNWRLSMFLKITSKKVPKHYYYWYCRKVFQISSLMLTCRHWQSNYLASWTWVNPLSQLLNFCFFSFVTFTAAMSELLNLRIKMSHWLLCCRNVVVCKLDFWTIYYKYFPILQCQQCLKMFYWPQCVCCLLCSTTFISGFNEFGDDDWCVCVCVRVSLMSCPCHSATY